MIDAVAFMRQRLFLSGDWIAFGWFKAYSQRNLLEYEKRL